MTSLVCTCNNLIEKHMKLKEIHFASILTNKRRGRLDKSCRESYGRRAKGAGPQSSGELRMKTLEQVLYWRSDWTIQTNVVKGISLVCLNDTRS